MALSANQIKALSISANQKTSLNTDLISSISSRCMVAFFNRSLALFFASNSSICFVFSSYILIFVCHESLIQVFKGHSGSWVSFEVILWSFGVILQWKPTRVAISIHIFLQLRIKILLWREVFQTRLTKDEIISKQKIGKKSARFDATVKFTFSSLLKQDLRLP